MELRNISPYLAKTIFIVANISILKYISIIVGIIQNKIVYIIFY